MPFIDQLALTAIRQPRLSTILVDFTLVEITASAPLEKENMRRNAQSLQFRFWLVIEELAQGPRIHLIEC